MTACIPNGPKAERLSAGRVSKKVNKWRFPEIPAHALLHDFRLFVVKLERSVGQFLCRRREPTSYKPTFGQRRRSPARKVASCERATREQRGNVELVRSSNECTGDFESTEEAFCCPDFRVTTCALCFDLPASIHRLNRAVEINTPQPQAQRSRKGFVHRLLGKIKISEQADQSGQDSSRIHAIKGVEQFAYLLGGTFEHDDDLSKPATPNQFGKAI